MISAILLVLATAAPPQALPLQPMIPAYADEAVAAPVTLTGAAQAAQARPAGPPDDNWQEPPNLALLSLPRPALSPALHDDWREPPNLMPLNGPPPTWQTQEAQATFPIRAPVRLATLVPARKQRTKAPPIPDMTSPADLYDIADAALHLIPKERHYEARFISVWPFPETERKSLDDSLRFWSASLSNRRTNSVPRQVAGLGWLIYLSDFGWTAEAWEALVANDPYFAVTQADHKGSVRRGWIEPVTEYHVRTATYSSRPIIRADRFLGLTGQEVGGGGFYSKFKKLPGSEAELFKQFGVDEKFLKDNYLIRGGAVLGGASIVAQHNRELQLLPSLIGSDERFVWRSLDMLKNINEQSVLRNFLGTVAFQGKEFIGTNLNGTHFYYLANAQNKQVAEVPTKIAQDHGDPHDVTVYTPWKCVKCHGPKGGIRHFDDVIARVALDPNVGLAVITKDHYRNDQVREALEDYYLSPLAKDINKHQASYRTTIKEINGLDEKTNAELFVKYVENYIYGTVGKQEAAAEFGVEPEQIGDYLKQTGNDALLAILAGQRVPREVFEQAFADGMRARIYPWERSPRHGELLKQIKDGRRRSPSVRPIYPDQYRGTGGARY